MSTSNLSPAKESAILIIGAGTFGISTAYHLAKRGYSNITCIDRHPWPSPDSAGHDLNRIIRTEYDEPLYTELALQALDAWRHPEWNGIFHETAGNDLNLRASDCPFNRDGSWVHSKKALEKWAAEAMRIGVKFISGLQGTITSIQVDSLGALTSVRVASGNVITADHYILSAGAASTEVLPELSKELWAKCWTTAQIELSETEMDQWKGVPVIDHGEFGFMVEPDLETRRINICNKGPGYQYRAGVYTESGKPVRYSIPRYASSHPHDGIPAEAKAAINRFIDTIMPQFSGRPLLDAKVSWYADSPDGHWLIDRHPRYKSLLVASGDSGHAFKMFPIIGAYIADALEGNPGGLRKEWQYGNRQAKGRSDTLETEVKDMRDVLGLRLGFKI